MPSPDDAAAVVAASGGAKAVPRIRSASHGKASENAEEMSHATAADTSKANNNSTAAAGTASGGDGGRKEEANGMTTSAAAAAAAGNDALQRADSVSSASSSSSSGSSPSSGSSGSSETLSCAGAEDGKEEKENGENAKKEDATGDGGPAQAAALAPGGAEDRVEAAKAALDRIEPGKLGAEEQAAIERAKRALCAIPSSSLDDDDNDGRTPAARVEEVEMTNRGGSGAPADTSAVAGGGGGVAVGSAAAVAATAAATAAAAMAAELLLPAPADYGGAMGQLCEARVVFVLGGPGCGKNCMSKMVADKYGFTHLSTHGVLAEEVRRESPIGKQIAALFSKEELHRFLHGARELDERVPSHFIDSLLAREVRKGCFEAKELSASHNGEVPGAAAGAAGGAEGAAAAKVRHAVPGFIIDGFPRDCEQAHKFEAEVAKVEFVVHIDAKVETMVARLKAAEHERCGTETVEHINQRLRFFLDNTLPVMQIYNDRDVTRILNAEGDRETVFARFCELFEKMQAIYDTRVARNNNKCHERRKSILKPPGGNPNPNPSGGGGQASKVRARAQSMVRFDSAQNMKKEYVVEEHDDESVTSRHQGCCNDCTIL